MIISPVSDFHAPSEGWFLIRVTIGVAGQRFGFVVWEQRGGTFEVDWDDGNGAISFIDTLVASSTRTYTTPGVYIVKCRVISGSCYLGWGEGNPGAESMEFLTRCPPGLLCISYGRMTTTVPGDLFFHTRLLAGDVSPFFRGLSGMALSKIPSRIFAGMSTLEAAYGCGACAGCTEIGEDVFQGCTSLKLLGEAFYGTSISSIPESIFQGLVSLENVFGAFGECYSLTSIPQNLFQDLPNLVDVSACFYYCTALTGTTPKIDGKELWDPSLGLTGTGCFEGCEGLDNYDEIPTEWKVYA